MTYQCIKCLWVWTPRPAALRHGDKPVRCPGCGSKNWEAK